MLQKLTRNRWFYSHYNRLAQFSTHETREGLIETNVHDSLFLTPQKHRDACDLRCWIKIGLKMLQKLTRNRWFYSHYNRLAQFSTHETREGLIETNVHDLLFLTPQKHRDACDLRRRIKFESKMLRKSTRNCQFYSHYNRPARFSTHETREGLIETNVLNSLFLIPQKHCNACDLRRWITDSRGSRLMRHAKVWSN